MFTHLMNAVSTAIAKAFESSETPIQRYFRTEYAKDYQYQARNGVRITDDLICNIIDERKRGN